MRPNILLAILPVALAVPSVKRDEPAPLLVGRDASTVIANKYIVKLKESSGASALSSSIGILSESPDHVYSDSFRGFSATLDDATLKAMRDQPDVEYIEQDAVISADAWISQKNAPWGLVRISHRQEVGTDYRYGDSGGAGTCVYVLDSGIEISHPEFQGRAKQIKTFVGDNKDHYGHGTHVAGIVGSKTYGVAKKTKLFGIKVLDNTGEGTWSGVIAGMEFIHTDMTYRKSGCPRGFMVNISIGGGPSLSANAAAKALTRKNIFVAASAGNGEQDASNSSPASEIDVCTVGAIDVGNERAYFSNYGKFVDIWAPGVSILSTYIGGTTAYKSGTSMASPFVAGLAAFIAGREDYSGRSLCDRIKIRGTKGILDVPTGTTNNNAFNGNPTG